MINVLFVALGGAFGIIFTLFKNCSALISVLYIVLSI